MTIILEFKQFHSFPVTQWYYQQMSLKTAEKTDSLKIDNKR